MTICCKSQKFRPKALCIASLFLLFTTGQSAFCFGAFPKILYVELVSEGHYQEAIDELSKQIALDPQKEELYLARCGVYEKIKDWNAALADINEAIRIHPDWAWQYGKRAEIEVELEQFDNALLDYGKSINGMKKEDAWGNKSRLLKLRAKLRHKLGDYSGEKSDLHLAVQQKEIKSASDKQRYSKYFRQLSSTKETVNCLNKILNSKNPFDPDFLQATIPWSGTGKYVSGIKSTYLYKDSPRVGMVDLQIAPAAVVLKKDLRLGRERNLPQFSDLYEYPWGFLDINAVDFASPDFLGPSGGRVSGVILRTKSNQFSQVAFKIGQNGINPDQDAKASLEEIDLGLKYDGANSYLHELRI